MKGIWFVLALASVVGCSSSEKNDSTGSDGGAESSSPDGASSSAAHPDGGSPGPFAGSWSCPYTTVSGFQDSTKVVFTAKADGTLSSTSMIQSDACALNWTISGSTANAIAGQTCGGFTVTSYAFKLEAGQDGLAFAVASAIEHGTSVASDGTSTPVDIAGSFGGFCTRDDAPDAGTPTICEPDRVVGCGANGVGYLCLGTSSPQSMNPAVSCPQLFTGGSSCCTLGAAASTCHADSTVACAGSRSGYSCTGTDTPAQAASVVCEPGLARGTGTTYCCGAYAAPSCTLTTGCGDYAFSCTGDARPWDADPTLRCGAANPDFGNASSTYCCSVRPASAPKTCAVDPTIDCAPTTGYSCTGADAPSDDDPSLTCGTATVNQGTSFYCCTGDGAADAGRD